MALSMWTRSAGGYVARSATGLYECRPTPFGGSGQLWTLYFNGVKVDGAAKRGLRTCKELAAAHERSTR